MNDEVRQKCKFGITVKLWRGKKEGVFHASAGVGWLELAQEKVIPLFSLQCFIAMNCSEEGKSDFGSVKIKLGLDCIAIKDVCLSDLYLIPP